MSAVQSWKTVLLSILLLSTAVCSKIKELECDENADRSLLEKCCVERSADSWTIWWPTRLELSNADLDKITHPQKVTGVWDECSAVLKLDNMLNYYQMHYQWGRQSLGDTNLNVMLVIWIPIVLFLFSLIASTADIFFVPTLTKLSSVLKLSPSVSGATLIALANGAPDFFCALAGMSGVQQIDTVIGGILGSAALITFLTLGVIITMAPFQTKKRLYVRDSCFYLLALALFGVAIHWETIPFWVGMLMFGVYGLYVLMVFFSKRLIKSMPQGIKRFFTKTDPDSDPDLFDSRPRQRSLALNIQNRTIEERIKSESPTETTDTVTNKHHGEDSLKELDISINEEEDESPQKDTHLVMNTTTTAISNGESDDNVTGSDDTKSKSERVSFSNPFAECFAFWKHLTEWKEQKCLNKIISVLQTPFALLQILSIPMLIDDDEYYHRGLLAFNLMLSPLCITFSFANAFLCSFDACKHIPIYVISVVFGVVSFWYLLPSNNAPKRKCIRILLLFVSVGCCASWIMLFANELLSLLGMIAEIIGMSDAGAGYTMLAMGNSAPDLMVNMAAARNGEAQTALTACYAGAIFNILCSFGVSIASCGIGNEMAVAANNKFAFTFGLLMAGAVFIFFKTLYSNYYLGKSTGIPAIVLYLVFLFCSIWGAFDRLGAPKLFRM